MTARMRINGDGAGNLDALRKGRGKKEAAYNTKIAGKGAASETFSTAKEHKKDN